MWMDHGQRQGDERASGASSSDGEEDPVGPPGGRLSPPGNLVRGSATISRGNMRREGGADRQWRGFKGLLMRGTGGPGGAVLSCGSVSGPAGPGHSS
ncbi:hypothetical protein AAFF_G00078750 [Aldrovandia affinis]|uniref:Uncharacterized protein n=1 Tax=Aldrovandia affinis TaxID=143900 RepID=A0AAD7WDL4_9TELE|nr:hypothetical protein AAFF_G00078750 [Aldrovandia affinis]